MLLPRLLLVVPLVAHAVLAGACANPTVDACNRFKDNLLALECVPDDYDPAIDCDEYNDYPCDASAYFECLEGSYSCDAEGNFQHDPNACVSVEGC